ncbi:hypothetical protein BgiMline_023583, partial [Biomphalaria glabrata]
LVQHCSSIKSIKFQGLGQDDPPAETRLSHYLVSSAPVGFGDVKYITAIESIFVLFHV